jgi:hypothetical protein
MAASKFDQFKAQICAGTASAADIEAACMSTAAKTALLIELADCANETAAPPVPLQTPVEDCAGVITIQDIEPVTVKGVVYTKSCDPAPVDYEYIRTPAMCVAGTWQYQIITMANGVSVGTQSINTGISCDEPMPVDVEVIQKERCNLLTGTIWKQPVIYVPSDPEDATTTGEVAVGVEYDTGISCEPLLQDIDVPNCAGVVESFRGVPVIPRGVSQVKECNSQAILDKLEEIELNQTGQTCATPTHVTLCDLEQEEPLRVEYGIGIDVPAGLKSVTINNLSGTTFIDGQFELGPGRRLASISFGTDRGNQRNETLPGYTLSGGTWQWVAHR